MHKTITTIFTSVPSVSLLSMSFLATLLTFHDSIENITLQIANRAKPFSVAIYYKASLEYFCKGPSIIKILKNVLVLTDVFHVLFSSRNKEDWCYVPSIKTR